MENCDYDLSKLRRSLAFPLPIRRLAIRPRNADTLRMYRADFFCLSFIWNSEKPMRFSYGRGLIDVEPPYLEILRPGEIIDMRIPSLRDETFFGYAPDADNSIFAGSQSCFFTLSPRMRRLRDELQEHLGRLEAPGAADRIDLIAVEMALEALLNRREAWRRRALPSGPDPRIFQVARRIELRFDEDIDLNEILAGLGIGYRTFYREWNKYFAEPPKRYLLRLRFDRACEMLRSGDKRIAEIADACGFTSAIHFSQLFRSRFGMTPGEYRRKEREETKNGRV